MKRVLPLFFLLPFLPACSLQHRADQAFERGDMSTFCELARQRRDRASGAYDLARCHLDALDGRRRNVREGERLLQVAARKGSDAAASLLQERGLPIPESYFVYKREQARRFEQMRDWDRVYPGGFWWGRPFRPHYGGWVTYGRRCW